MEKHRIYDLLERIAALLRASEWTLAKAHDLQPAHLHSLHYLSRCNRYSDTPAALTAYLGATKGTISQTLIVLENRGLIEKRIDPKDKRQVRLGLTTAGRRVLRECVPPPILQGACADADSLGTSLEALLRRMQRASGQAAFGICGTCMHFRRNALGERHQCGLTLEPLSPRESTLICREHAGSA